MTCEKIVKLDMYFNENAKITEAYNSIRESYYGIQRKLDNPAYSDSYRKQLKASLRQRMFRDALTGFRMAEQGSMSLEDCILYFMRLKNSGYGSCTVNLKVNGAGGELVSRFCVLPFNDGASGYGVKFSTADGSASAVAAEFTVDELRTLLKRVHENFVAHGMKNAKLLYDVGGRSAELVTIKPTGYFSTPNNTSEITLGFR